MKFDKFNGLTIVKFFCYIVGKVLAACACVYAVWFCLFCAFNTVNANVVIKDVFTKRTSIIFEPEENQEKELISKICTKEYINSSGLLTEDFNSAYVINAYQQRTDVPYMIILPWEKTRKYTVTNKISDVSIAYSEKSTGYDAEPYFPTGIFEVTVIKGNEKDWYVSSIVLKEQIETEYKLPEREVTEEESDVIEVITEEPIEEAEEDL